MLKLMLDDLAKGTLDQGAFPYTRPPLDDSDEKAAQSQASLRSAKPTWARNRMSTVESRQRVIVFMAGGATYSESRACYEVSKTSGRDVFLATSQMLTPALYIRQVGDLSVDRRRLDLPADRPKPKAPSHLFERNDAPKPPPTLGLPARGALPKSPGVPLPPQKSPGYDNQPRPIAPPTTGMAAMTINSTPVNGNGMGDAEPKVSWRKKASTRTKEKRRRRKGISLGVRSDSVVFEHIW